MVGVDVGQAQAAVMAGEAGLHWLEHICPLQEVETDHRGYQDWQLLMAERKKYEGVQSHKAKAGGSEYCKCLHNSMVQ